eukprot:gene31263-38630_t
MAIKQHITSGYQVSRYLADFVEEVQRDTSTQATREEVYNLIKFVSTHQHALRSLCLSSDFPLLLDGDHSDISSDTRAMSCGDMIHSLTHCAMFDRIPPLCERYVRSDSVDRACRGEDGVSSQLHEQCHAVWERAKLSHESTMTHNNTLTSDGHFTHIPVDMWVFVHHHLQLAVEAKCDALLAMLMECAAVSVGRVVERITRYVADLDSQRPPEGDARECEIQFLCMLANDTTLHHNEITDLLDSSHAQNVREKVKGMFESLNAQLVHCGEVCLKRLSAVIASTVVDQFEQIFTEVWIEGRQMAVIVATVADFLKTLRHSLVPQLADRAAYMLFREVILRYAQRVVFPPLAASSHHITSTSNPSNNTTSRRIFSVFRLSGNSSTAHSTQAQITQHHHHHRVRIDDDSRGQFAQDVSALNVCILSQAGETVAAGLMEILADIALYLVQSAQVAAEHVKVRVAE